MCMNERVDKEISRMVFFLINIPVWLFGAGFLLSLLLVYIDFPPFRILYMIPAWWCVCGAVMLLLDYKKRKRELYLRMLSTGEVRTKSAAVRSLKQTVCGWSLYFALRYQLGAKTGRVSG